jgi:hypothetical protein
LWSRVREAPLSRLALVVYVALAAIVLVITWVLRYIVPLPPWFFPIVLIIALILLVFLVAIAVVVTHPEKASTQEQAPPKQRPVHHPIPQFSDKWAILVGINNYQHVPPLQFCKNDVVDLSAHLQQYLNFEGSKIVEFLEGSNLPPERDQIFNRLSDLARSKEISEDDFLLFFFSGHGILNEDDGKDYLLPLAAKPENVQLTGIKVRDLVDQLKKTKCKNIVLFIDACRETITGAKGAASIGEDSRAAVERAGIVSFFSCEPKERSYEIDDLKHGSFTACLLSAIGDAHCNTVSDVDEYLRKHVPRLNETNLKPYQEPWAKIYPFEKGQLPIFLRPDVQLQTANELDKLLEALGDMYAADQIEESLYCEAVDTIEQSKIPTSEEAEGRKLDLIRKLVDGTMNAKQVMIALQAYERKRVIPGSAIRSRTPERSSIAHEARSNISDGK